MVGGVFQASTTADFSAGVTTLYTVTAAPPSGGSRPSRWPRPSRPATSATSPRPTATGTWPRSPSPPEPSPAGHRIGRGGIRTLNLYDYESWVLTIKLHARRSPSILPTRRPVSPRVTVGSRPEDDKSANASRDAKGVYRDRPSDAGDGREQDMADDQGGPGTSPVLRGRPSVQYRQRARVVVTPASTAPPRRRSCASPGRSRPSRGTGSCGSCRGSGSRRPSTPGRGR